MSSITSPRGSNQDGSIEPYLVIESGQDIWSFEYLPDGRHVVTGCWYGTLRIWNLESGKQEGAQMEHRKCMSDFAVTRDGTKIVSSDGGGGIRVWDVESHELVKEWTHPERFPKIAISPEGLVAVGQKNVGIYTMEGRRVDSVKFGDFVWRMCFSPDGKKLVCQTEFDIRVYDFASGRLIHCPFDGDWVDDVLWSRDGSRLFSGSDDETILCWNSDTGQQIGHPWTGHTDYIRSLSLSPDGLVLASASWDGTVRFWNATTGDPIGQHLQHDEVTKVRFSPSGESVASAGGGKIYLWRVPWLDSLESQTGLANLDVPHKNVLNPPSPYSTHILGAEQVLDLPLDLFTIHGAYPITSCVVPNSHPSPLIPNSNPDENDSSDTFSVSNEVDLQYILPHPSLGLDEGQHIFELRLRKLVDLATSKGFRVPQDLVPSNLTQGIRNTGLESIEDVDRNSMHPSQSGPSTSIFRSASNGDPRKIRKIDKIKQKLVEMLRETGFKLSNGRLPWSTLDRDLQRKGYMMINWPQGVVRDRDKGVSGLSAEDADKLHDALFIDEQRLQFVPRGDESAYDNEGVPSLEVGSGSDCPRESDHLTKGKQARFRVTTADEYPHKKRRL